MPSILRKQFGFLCLIFFLGGTILSAQQNVADSIKRVLGFTNDVERIKLLFRLSEAYLKYAPKKAVESAMEARVLANQIGNDSLQAASLFQLGKVYSKVGKFKESLPVFEEARTRFLQLGNKKSAAKCSSFIGESNQFMGNYNEALSKSFESYTEFERIGDKQGMASALILSGLVYRSMENYNKSILDFEKAMNLSKEINDLSIEASCLNNLANVYGDLENYDTAIVLQKQAVEIYQSLNDKYNEGKVLNNIGTVYLSDSLYEKASDYFLMSLDIRKQIGDVRGQAITLINLGIVAQETGNVDKAIEYYQRGMELAKKSGASDLVISIYEALSEAYSRKKDYELSLLYMKKVGDLKDSVFSENLSESIAEMQAKYGVEKAESETRAQAKEKKLITIAAAVGGFLLIVIIFFFWNRAMVRKKTNIRLNAQKEEIERKNLELHAANKEIELKNKDITDSIMYASRIQEAILPEVEFANTFRDKGFVLYRPKDIVSGDFYWMAQTPEFLLFAAVDCTGHGVPGAFMSIVCSNLLSQAVKEHLLTQPNEILDDVNIRLSETLRQRQDESRVRDGMDIALCAIHKKSLKLSYAGAFNPLWIFRKDELVELLPDKFPVGLFIEEELKKFTPKEFQLNIGDRIYIASDGFSDQFGGAQGKKFKRSAFVELLRKIQVEDISQHRGILEKEHLSWRGNFEQIDDVLVMGIEIS